MEYHSFTLEVRVEPDEDLYHAWCPKLVGLHTQGETQANALGNAFEAASAYIESMIKHLDAIEWD